MQGSQRPMGLYTYDVSLELVLRLEPESGPDTPGMDTPAPRDTGTRRPSANVPKPQVQRTFWMLSFMLDGTHISLSEEGQGQSLSC